MLPSCSVPKSGRLFTKYLLVVVPILLVSAAYFHSLIANHSADRALEHLTARVGGKTASIATTLEYHYSSGNQRAAQDLINLLLSDPAIECAELGPGNSGGKRLQAPQGLGCKGVGDLAQLRVGIDAASGSSLAVRYNIEEVNAALTAHREVSIPALLLGLFVAVTACFVGFWIIINRPLRRLLCAIEDSAGGKFQVHTEKVPNDELGTVIKAFNDMQMELKRAYDNLESEVAERTNELQTANQNLKDSQLRLLQAERLSTLGQVTATMSHEIRNPLGAIRSSLYIIREAAKKATLKLDRPLDRIERSVARCDNIIGDFLEYTRTKAVTIKPVDGSKYLNELLDEQAMPAGIVLKRDLPAPGPEIAVDPDRFRRIIINLVDNAAQAIKTSSEKNGEITVSCGVHGNGSVICVEDNGPGIPEDVLPRIFEPLFTTKNLGAGLGLPTVKELVDQHGAELQIDTELGVGTTFRVVLPSASAVVSDKKEMIIKEKAA